MERNHEFESVSDLIGELSFLIKKKEKKKMKKVYKKLKKHNFVEKPHKFSDEVIDGLFKDLKHKKVEHPYVELQVQDAEKIEREAKKENEKFLDLYKKFNEVNDAATQQKKDNEVIDLIDDIKDEGNPFNDTFKADLRVALVKHSLGYSMCLLAVSGFVKKSLNV